MAQEVTRRPTALVRYGGLRRRLRGRRVGPVVVVRVGLPGLGRHGSRVAELQRHLEGPDHIRECEVMKAAKGLAIEYVTDLEGGTPEQDPS